ncbi:MAG: NTP transferase domain-containing protein, partial [Desulfosarcinaceae bacterium]
STNTCWNASQTLKAFAPELIVAAPNPEHFLHLDALVVKSTGEAPGQLSELHAGLFHADQPLVLVVGAGQPLVRHEILQTLLKRVAPGLDIIAPAPAAGISPFPAIYATACQKRLANMLSQGRSGFEPLFKKARMKVVSEKVLRQNDPELISFLNLGRSGDVDKIRTWVDAHPL